MGITVYYKNIDLMPEELGKGRLAEYPDVRADSLAAGEEIEFGKAIEYDSEDDGVVKEFNDGTFAGIAMAKHYADYVDKNLVDSDGKEDEVPKYSKYDAVTVLRKAIVWVEVLESVEKGEKAVIDEETGNFRPADTDEEDVTEVDGMVFKSAADENELAKLEINLPG